VPRYGDDGAAMPLAGREPLIEAFDVGAAIGLLQNGGFNDIYTANNQMFGYPYDAAGNLLSDGLGNVMTWDAESRISTVGGASYVYDPLGQRVGKQGVGLTDTVYFGGQPNPAHWFEFAADRYWLTNLFERSVNCGTSAPRRRSSQLKMPFSSV